MSYQTFSKVKQDGTVAQLKTNYVNSDNCVPEVDGYLHIEDFTLLYSMRLSEDGLGKLYKNSEGHNDIPQDFYQFFEYYDWNKTNDGKIERIRHSPFTNSRTFNRDDF